jgi:hypothetical protein
MIITIDVSSCPKCSNIYDMNYYSLSTGLGPVLAKCNRCKAVFSSGKKEWIQMSSDEKVGFWILSSLYAVISGEICGILFSCLIKFLCYGSIRNWPEMYSPIYMFLASICSLPFIMFIFYAQIKRVMNSKFRLSRTARSSVPVVISFTNFDFGLQLKFLYLYMILLPVLGLLVFYYEL